MVTLSGTSHTYYALPLGISPARPDRAHSLSSGRILVMFSPEFRVSQTKHVRDSRGGMRVGMLGISSLHS